MNQAILSLGSNMGDKIFYLKEAIHQLSLKVGKINKVSSVYETEPWGMENSDNFYNIALALQTELNPNQLLHTCLKIESDLGRIRSLKGYSSRTIDIDILFFNDEIITDDALTIPHPHIRKRNFVLIPLTEIMPEYIHPEFKKTMKDFSSDSQDSCTLKKVENVHLSF